MKVLIIEDNPLNMELATDVLAAAGYTILQANNAEIGIALAQSEAPALILLDLSLPGMDGLTAVTILKRDPSTSHIPVVALTAHAMKGDEEKALAAGCDAYLTKPIQALELPKTVGKMIESRSGVRK
jgi:two-component system cell cycle response regulator DivK